MSRLLKIAGLSALLLASSASAQVPGQHLVYSKTGYAPQMAMNPQQAVAYSVNGNTHYMPTMEATGGAPALYNKAARIPIYAPGPVTYHQQVIPGQGSPQCSRQQVPVQYQQQIIQTEKPVVYEAAVLPVVKGVDGAVQQQQYATAPAPSGYPAQQQIVQGQQYFQTQSGQYVQ